ncbi:MAG TPA: hypothetical protein DHW50_04545 [Akkermansia sp.]|uniref:Uncharacterized protein n=1 Tax=Akkermansia massiliensis TaxID=2927224 RepID=A0AAE6W391_9BACT|nr:hypothetical protein CXU18_10865 [Akkermansia muciniphila]PNC52185.1 hypothetical protein CXU15_03730 [Akkermansia muciniphila]QHV64158.1 hypothetical protein DMI76_12670 [Akkermansia massiliensis]QUY60476.1 hypothetical protein DMI77_12685 [Akkermansia muciniphila]HCL32915.1 hypothetical protein [Akkermansia sp.]
MYPACSPAFPWTGAFPWRLLQWGNRIALPAWRPSPELLEWTGSIAVLSLKRLPRAWEKSAERQEYSPGRGNLLKLKILK